MADAQLTRDDISAGNEFSPLLSSSGRVINRSITVQESLSQQGASSTAQEDLLQQVLLAEQQKAKQATEVARQNQQQQRKEEGESQRGSVSWLNFDRNSSPVSFRVCDVKMLQQDMRQAKQQDVSYRSGFGPWLNTGEKSVTQSFQNDRQAEDTFSRLHNQSRSQSLIKKKRSEQNLFGESSLIEQIVPVPPSLTAPVPAPAPAATAATTATAIPLVISSHTSVNGKQSVITSQKVVGGATSQNLQQNDQIPAGTLTPRNAGSSILYGQVLNRNMLNTQQLYESPPQKRRRELASIHKYGQSEVLDNLSAQNKSLVIFSPIKKIDLNYSFTRHMQQDQKVLPVNASRKGTIEADSSVLQNSTGNVIHYSGAARRRIVLNEYDDEKLQKEQEETYKNQILADRQPRLAKTVSDIQEYKQTVLMQKTVGGALFQQGGALRLLRPHYLRSQATQQNFHRAVSKKQSMNITTQNNFCKEQIYQNIKQPLLQQLQSKQSAQRSHIDFAYLLDQYEKKYDKPINRLSNSRGHDHQRSKSPPAEQFQAPPQSAVQRATRNSWSTMHEANKKNGTDPEQPTFTPEKTVMKAKDNSRRQPRTKCHAKTLLQQKLQGFKGQKSGESHSPQKTPFVCQLEFQPAEITGMTPYSNLRIKQQPLTDVQDNNNNSLTTEHQVAANLSTEANFQTLVINSMGLTQGSNSFLALRRKLPSTVVLTNSNNSRKQPKQHRRNYSSQTGVARSSEKYLHSNFNKNISQAGESSKQQSQICKTQPDENSVPMNTRSDTFFSNFLAADCDQNTSVATADIAFAEAAQLPCEGTKTPPNFTNQISNNNNHKHAPLVKKSQLSTKNRTTLRSRKFTVPIQQNRTHSDVFSIVLHGQKLLHSDSNYSNFKILRTEEELPRTVNVKNYNSMLL